MIGGTGWIDLGRTLVPRRDRIYMCGRLVISMDGRRIENLLPGRQGRLTFAYLVVNRGKTIERHQLVEALWGENPPAEPDAALSAILSKLRRAIAPATIEGRSSLTIELPDGIWIDVDAASEALHRAEPAAAQGRYYEAWSPGRVALHIAMRGLLPEFDAAWIEPHRARVEDLYLRALDCYGRACLEIGGSELSGAERSARTLMRVAPYRESGYRMAMEAFERAGNPAEALRIFETLRVVLRDDLGVIPGAMTQALHRQILAGCD